MSAAQAEWLTVAEVAERVRLAPKTIRSMIDRGELAASRVAGGRYRIPVGAVELYMAERAVVPAPGPPRPESSETERSTRKRREA